MSETQDLEPGEQMAALVIVVLVALLGVLGFVNSFARVADAVRPYFGDLAPTVPLGVDIGICAFTGLDLLMAKTNMRTRWLRFVPWSLVAATVYLNVAAEDEWIGRVAHGVLPLLWVIAVEAGAHVVRVKAGLRLADPRMDRVRVSRWVLAPGSTAALWRRMILWEERSYPDALRRERDRLLALCALQDRYGRVKWRWKAPRQQRVLQRLGELTPTGVVKEIPAELPASQPAPDPGAAHKSRRLELAEPEFKSEAETLNSSPRRPATDFADLLPVAREVVAELGRVPGWKPIAAAVRAKGLGCSTKTAQALVDAMKAEALAKQNGRADVSS